MNNVEFSSMGLADNKSIANNHADVCEQRRNYLDCGVNIILALCGGHPFDVTGTGGVLHYDTELARFDRKEFGDKLTIAFASSPEGHIQCITAWKRTFLSLNRRIIMAFTILDPLALLPCL